MVAANNKQIIDQTTTDFFASALFKQVQMSGLFADSKTFVDATPKLPLNEILKKFSELQTQSQQEAVASSELLSFVEQYFTLPDQTEITLTSASNSIEQHIFELWPVLTKPADKPSYDSLLALSKPYVVPGGRFREIYYWDSYFTALGLIASGRQSTVVAMLDNFVSLQSRYGCIPNGNRSYYLTRSQPPILGLLVELLLPFQTDKASFIKQYIGSIEKEYAFWMDGDHLLNNDITAYRRVVRMPDGSILNRYWDDSDTPRPESYREDVELFSEASPEKQEDFFRNIRAACESGWDFSTRWLGQDYTLASIRTTRIVPVDLNSLLYKIECLLREFMLVLGHTKKSHDYQQKAQRRQQAINRYMWSSDHGFFVDYDIDCQEQQSRPVLSLAGAVPLFVALASDDQAQLVAKKLEHDFLKTGGLVTTLVESKQQWDSPNGWAPLHWFAIQGLLNYENTTLAVDIATRWNRTVKQFFEQSGKLMEKYNVCQLQSKASGGEYDVQEGFGWTNGVYLVLEALIQNTQEK
ncbi:alpha,alpha-trehalase TreF [Thalassotalea fusca]